MLRILENGKPISLKEQTKRTSVKGSPENVGYPVNFDRPAMPAKPKYPGLRKAKAPEKKVSNAKAKR